MTELPDFLLARPDLLSSLRSRLGCLLPGARGTDAVVVIRKARSEYRSGSAGTHGTAALCDVRFWHKTDIAIVLNHVRFRGKADIV